MKIKQQNKINKKQIRVLKSHIGLIFQMNYIQKIVQYIIRPHRDQYRIKKLGDPQITIQTKSKQTIQVQRQDRIILNKNNQCLHLSYYEIQNIQKQQPKLPQSSQISYQQAQFSPSSGSFQSTSVPNSKNSRIIHQRNQLQQRNRLDKVQQKFISYHYQTTVKKYQKKCVIYLHANNGSRMEGIYYLENLLKAHCNVCLFDCSGSGNSDGEYVTLGLKQARDLDSVVNFLIKQKKIQAISLWGRSMGASTALIYCSKILPVNISSIILDSPFKDLQKLIKQIASDKTGLPKVFFNPLIPFVKDQIIKKTGYNIQDLKLKKYIQTSKKRQKKDSKLHIDELSSQTEYNTNQCIPKSINPLHLIPALFIVSQNDKFVRCHHGQKLYKRYPCQRKQLFNIDIQHHQSRDEAVINKIISFIVDNFENPLIKQTNSKDKIDFSLSFSKMPHTKSRNKSKKQKQQFLQTQRNNFYDNQLKDNKKSYVSHQNSFKNENQFSNNSQRYHFKYNGSYLSNFENYNQKSSISLPQAKQGPIQKLRKNIQILCNNQKKTIRNEIKNSIQVNNPNQKSSTTINQLSDRFNSMGQAFRKSQNFYSINNKYDINQQYSYNQQLYKNNKRLFLATQPNKLNEEQQKGLMHNNSMQRINKFIQNNYYSSKINLNHQNNSANFISNSIIPKTLKDSFQNNNYTFFSNIQKQQNNPTNNLNSNLNNNFNNSISNNFNNNINTYPNTKINVGTDGKNYNPFLNRTNSHTNPDKFDSSNNNGNRQKNKQKISLSSTIALQQKINKQEQKNNFNLSQQLYDRLDNNSQTNKNINNNAHNNLFNDPSRNTDTTNPKVYQKNTQHIYFNIPSNQSIYFNSHHNDKLTPNHLEYNSPYQNSTNYHSPIINPMFYSPGYQKSSPSINTNNILQDLGGYSLKRETSQRSFIQNNIKFSNIKPYNAYNSFYDSSSNKNQLPSTPTPMKKLQNLTSKKINSTHTSFIFDNSNSSTPLNNNNTIQQSTVGSSTPTKKSLFFNDSIIVDDNLKKTYFTQQKMTSNNNNIKYPPQINNSSYRRQ